MRAIEVKGVQKKFRLFYDKSTTLKEKLLFTKRNYHKDHLVLRGIDLSVDAGEAVGIIGENGCGKSTMLKLLTKIMYPDAGTIDIKGRVSSLIELGAGFHPDMSGRENIYTNASIFGLTRKEIDERVQTIIEFSELGEYIDNPVRTYSSGMYMRLAFAVAINVDADVLLVDEILGVGDASFQAKCFNKMREIKGRGTTIVIVSHSLGQIEQICERSYWIRDGLIYQSGSPNEVHRQYLEYMGEKYHSQARSEAEKPTTEAVDPEAVKEETKAVSDPEPSQKEKIAEIVAVSIVDHEGKAANRFTCGQSVTLKIEYKAQVEKVDNPMIGLLFFRNDNIVGYGTNTQRERITNIQLKETGEILCHIDKFNFLPGEYWIDVAIRSKDMFAYDYRERAFHFSMYSTIDEVGMVRIEHRWEFH